MATRMKVGDRVRVTPDNPIAVGRGVGTVCHVGDTLVRVIFAQWNRPIACLRTDCTKVSNPNTAFQSGRKRANL